MKFNISLILLLFASVFMIGCHTILVDPGHEAVVIDKPCIAGHEGIRNEPIGPGRTYTWVSASHIIYNLQPTPIKETFQDLITADNNPVDFDAILTYQILTSRTPELHEKFGESWYEFNIQPQFRNYVRDLAKMYKMFELTSSAEVSKIVEDSLSTLMSKLFLSKNIPVKVISVTLGKINPPAEVMTETNKTAAQVQRIATENQIVKAEQARAAAERARAEADLAYFKTMGMTIPQYLELETIKAMKSSEHLTMIVGTSVQPTIQVNR